jgi:hypothetical protein
MIVKPLTRLPASRRQFLASAAIGGTALIIGTHLPLPSGALAADARRRPTPSSELRLTTP